MFLDRLIPDDWGRKLLRRWGLLGLVPIVLLAVAIEWCEQSAVEQTVKVAVTGCTESAESQSRRAAGVYQSVRAKYGEPTREEQNDDVLVYEGASAADGKAFDFVIRLDDDRDPCYWELWISAKIAPADEDASAGLMAALDDYDIGRHYERVGFFSIHDGWLWLNKHVPLKTESYGSTFWVDDHLELADYWATQWLRQVEEVQAGRAPKPRQYVYRPGRDPESVLARAEAWLDGGWRDASRD